MSSPICRPGMILLCITYTIHVPGILYDDSGNRVVGWNPRGSNMRYPDIIADMPGSWYTLTNLRKMGTPTILEHVSRRKYRYRSARAGYHPLPCYHPP